MKVADVEQVLDWREIENLVWHPMPDAQGVSTKVLWRDPSGVSCTGFMRIEPGASLASHTHRFAAHHLLILEGTARVGSNWLRPGGYAFVPAGAPHSFAEVGPQGCVLFFCYFSLADFD